MKEEKKETKKINLYEKITNIKSDFLKANVKKSGKNKFANYTYYELADITPVLIELCKQYKVFTKFSYTKEFATLEIVNIENPTEREIYTSPMEDLDLKGCNKIQALGGVETYQRRYLYLSAMDIIENDMFDSTISEEKEKQTSDNNIYLKIKKLMNEKKVLANEISDTFQKNSADMTQEELEEVVKWLEEK
jgi:hypothetical protein